MLLFGKGIKLILEDFHEFHEAIDELLTTKNYLTTSTMQQ